MSRKAAFHTLGCKVNAYETEAMAERLREAGYTIVPFEPGADVYIVNTCAVTGIAGRKSRQMLHRAKEMNPDAYVVAAGCYAEDAGKELSGDPCVDLVLGNASKSDIAVFLDAALEGGGNYSLPGRIPAAWAKTYDESGISDTSDRTRAYIKIQDGCNQFCAYCLIPYVRGRVRSRKAEDVIAETERLSRAGFREIVVTGIHISSYGLDFDHPGENRCTPPAGEAETNRRFLDLIADIAAVPGISRVRLGSLEPGIMTEEFIRGIAAIPEICPQFHLSLQSGCDATLERMRRRYRTDDYKRICGLIRGSFPEAALTTDVIVGFPGETDREFEETCRFAEEIGFAKIHVFKYSKRRGTAAAAMPGQVPEPLKKKRSSELIALDRRMRREYADRFAGRDVEVLFEEPAEAAPNAGKRTSVSRGTGMSGQLEGNTVLWRGRTREALDLVCRSRENLTGRIMTCRADRVMEDGTLWAAPLNSD